MDLIVKEVEEELRKETIEYCGYENAIIDDAISYERAGEIVIKGKSILKEIDLKFKDPVEKAYAAHKAVKALQNEMKAPVEKVVDVLTSKLKEYARIQERQRREAQAALDRERLRQEEEERQKLLIESEKARMTGDTEKAEELILEAETVVVIPEISKAEISKTTRSDVGTISNSVDIEIEISDSKLFLAAIAEKGLFDFVEFKQAKIKQYCKLLKITEFPGLKIEETIKQSFRSK